MQHSSNIFFIITAAFLICSCTRETCFEKGERGGTGIAEISFTTCGTPLKSCFSGSEDGIEDWNIYVYDKNGIFVKRLSSDSSDNVFYATVGDKYDFFALANFSDILTANSSGYKELEKADMTEMENLCLNPLPLEYSQKLGMAWAVKDHVITGNENILVQFRRLFAKIILTVSKSRLHNADIRISDAFIVSSRPLTPFSSYSIHRGYSQEKVDYAERQDIERLDSGGSIAMYMPESVIPFGIGTPLISNSWDKDLMLINSRGYRDFASMCSYIELRAEYSRIDRISPEELQYLEGKTASYRFILGGNEINDFNVNGNSIYHLYLYLTDDGVFRDCWRASLDDYYGCSCLIRWEDRNGDSDIANAVNCVTIDNSDISCTVYPKVVFDGSVLADQEIKITYPYLAVRTGKNSVLINGASVSGNGRSGITIKGGDGMVWSDFPITAEWTDDKGNSISSILMVRLRPSALDIEEPEDNGSLQNIVF